MTENKLVSLRQERAIDDPLTDILGAGARSLIARAVEAEFAAFLASHDDKALIAKLKRRAARHGRSAEAEHRAILRRALENDPEASFDDLAAELRKLNTSRSQTPSEDLLREGREER